MRRTQVMNLTAFWFFTLIASVLLYVYVKDTPKAVFDGFQVSS